MPHILIVDDDPDVRRPLRSRIEGTVKESTVAEAESFEDAQRAFAENQPDLIFVDGQLLGDPFQAPSGPRFVENLRQLGYLGHIVAFSSNTEIQRKLVVAGCNLELLKGGSARIFDKLEEIFIRAGLLNPGGP